MDLSFYLSQLWKHLWGQLLHESYFNLLHQVRQSVQGFSHRRLCLQSHDIGPHLAHPQALYCEKHWGVWGQRPSGSPMLSDFPCVRILLHMNHVVTEAATTTNSPPHTMIPTGTESSVPELLFFTGLFPGRQAPFSERAARCTKQEFVMDSV